MPDTEWVPEEALYHVGLTQAPLGSDQPGLDSRWRSHVDKYCAHRRSYEAAHFSFIHENEYIKNQHTVLVVQQQAGLQTMSPHLPPLFAQVHRQQRGSFNFHSTRSSNC